LTVALTALVFRCQQGRVELNDEDGGGDLLQIGLNGDLCALAFS
jgi:hypothetical protein